MNDGIKVRIALVLGASFALSSIFENIRHAINLYADHDHDVGFAPMVQTPKVSRALNSKDIEILPNSKVPGHVNHTKLMEERQFERE